MKLLIHVVHAGAKGKIPARMQMHNVTFCRLNIQALACAEPLQLLTVRHEVLVCMMSLLRCKFVVVTQESKCLIFYCYFVCLDKIAAQGL